MTLQKNVFLILVGLLLGMLLLIAGVGFFTTQSSVRDLRRTIMAATERHVAGELWHYFAETGEAIEFMEEVAFEDPEEALLNWRETSMQLADYMDSNGTLSFLYYADAKSGNLVGVQRDVGGALVVHHTIEANDRVPQTFQVMPGDQLEPYTSETVTSAAYDPRERPWFKAAVAGDGIVWTPPYTFLQTDASGVSATLAKRNASGEVVGVFAVDLALGDVAQFLAELQVGDEGAVFLLQEDGSFLVDAKYRTRPESLQIRSALAKHGAMGSTTEAGEFRCEECDIDYLVEFEPVERPGGDTVNVAVVVPQSAFMGVVARNAWLTLLGGLSAVALAIAVSVYFSHRITRRLSKISAELERVGRLDLSSDSTTRRQRSRIQEIARFDDSVGRMKMSLRSFSRYVPRDIVRRLVETNDEAKLGGEMREVTVQFTDLAGFTSMSEELDSDAVFRELRIFLEALAEAQRNHGGITSNFTGDGTMALFNAPDEQCDHAEQAVASALEFAAKLKEINAERSTRGRPQLSARVGLNTAEVLVGNLGTSDRFTYTAVGDGVNIASRLEGLNKLYGTGILVGEMCREQAGDVFEWRRVDRLSVVGRRSAITLFEPLGRQGEVAAEVLQRRDRYEEGLDAYRAGDFSGAVAIFEELRRDDPAGSVLHSRASEMLHSGIPDGWDGTFAAPFK
jgi:adenylate cyclase